MKLQAFQLVVCIDDGYNDKDDHYAPPLEKGHLYVLAGVCNCEEECGAVIVVGILGHFHESRFRGANVKDEVIFKYKPAEERLDVILK